MSVKVKSNSTVKEIVDLSEFNALKDIIYLTNIHRVRFIRGTGGEIYIAFDLDKDGSTRRVLELNGSKITYFNQFNGEVTQKYWEK